MHMSIDNARQYRSAPGIDDHDFIRDLEIGRQANGDNAIPLNSNKTIGNGIGPRAVNDDPIGYD
jgi:hypothetical protein